MCGKLVTCVLKELHVWLNGNMCGKWVTLLVNWLHVFLIGYIHVLNMLPVC